MGSAASDRFEYGQSYGLFPRAGTLHVPGGEHRELAQGIARAAALDLVGWVLVGTGTLQHGGRARGDYSQPRITESGDLGERSFARDAQSSRRRDLYLARRPRRLARAAPPI